MVLLLGVAALPLEVSAQHPSGHVSAFVDYMPDREHTTELRLRVFAEQTFDPTPWLRLAISGFAEGLAARRPELRSGGSRGVTDGIVQLRDGTAEVRLRKLDLLVGYGRVMWGRLDELQPTDVVNPLDASRFFFEGRGEARLPVLLARGRLTLGEGASVEGVYVPWFRRGQYDQLDEATSPFNLTGAVAAAFESCCLPVAPTIVRDEPSLRGSNAQGGARLSVTTGRVDWSVVLWRGFEPFGLIELEPTASPPLAVVERYPRFTMLGGDFETVAGAWGVRGEVAVFTADSFQSPDLRIVKGSSVEAGLGVDRRAGDLTLSGTVLLHLESPDDVSGATPERRRDVTFVASADRTFGRERYRVRAFAVYTPQEASTFLRGIGSVSLRDNVLLEGSLGVFAGEGQDLVGRFAANDFTYARLKFFF